MHTPGPWRVKDRDIVAGNTHVVCFGHDYDDYGGIGGRFRSGRSGPSEAAYAALQAEIAANARLIAAAPELLEALEREHSKSTHMGFGPVGRTETGSYIHGMIDYGKGCSTCSVIAKARGESESAPPKEGASR